MPLDAYWRAYFPSNMSDVPFDASTDDTEQEQELPEQLVPVVELIELIEQLELSQQDTLDLARLLLAGLALDHQEVLVGFMDGAASGEACVNPAEVIAWSEGLTVINNSLELLAGLSLEDPADDDAVAQVDRHD